MSPPQPPHPIPPHAALRRTLGPFTAETMPAGLRGDHRTGAGRWGCLRVVSGIVEFCYADYPAVLTLAAGQHVVIEPERTHRVAAEPDAEFTLEIYEVTNTEIYEVTNTEVTNTGPAGPAGR